MEIMAIHRANMFVVFEERYDDSAFFTQSVKATFFESIDVLGEVATANHVLEKKRSPTDFRSMGLLLNEG